MIKKCYLTEFEQNILQQFGIVDQAKTEQLEFLQNVKIGNMEGGFNGFIWYGELVKFYQENREIIHDIYRRKKAVMPKKYIQGMNASEVEIKKVLQFSFSENEFVSDTEDWESQVMTFIVWFSVEQSIRFIKEKLYAFGD